MATIINSTPWTSQPQQAVGIDWSNPITRGLVLDVDFNGGVRDRVSGMIATPTVGRATPITTSQGVAARFSSTVYSFGDVELFKGAEAAWQILEIPDSLTQQAGLVNKRTNVNTQHSFSMGYNYTTNEFEVDVGSPAGAAGAAYRFSRAGFSTSGNNIVTNINFAQSAGNRIKAWRNGASLGVTVGVDSVGGVITNTTAPLEIGRVNSATYYYAGNLLIVRAWNRVLSDAEVQSISQNPWQIFKPLPRRIFVPVSSAGGLYTLTAQSGSYTISGQQATLLRHRNLTANTGTYNITGQSVNITYSPTAAVYTLTAQAGSYSLTGLSATLLKSKLLSTSSGSYSITGNSATISKNRVLTATSGSYTITGRSATLMYVPLTPVYTLTAQTGVYNITGQTAQLLRHRLLTTSAGSYVYTGQSITINKYTSGTSNLVKYVNVLTGEVLILKQLGV